MDIHISQFYSCSKVTLACELYYICELGKYTKINHGQSVSLDGVILDKRLKKSVLWDYFRLSVEQGWLTNVGVSEESIEISIQNPLNITKTEIANFLYVLDEVAFDSEDHIKRNSDRDYDIRTPMKAQVSFNRRDKEAWIWTTAGEGGTHFTVNNNAFNHNHADQSWLSLIAMVAVNRLFTEEPKILGILLSNNTILNPMAISYILLLDDETNALTNWCSFSFDETIQQNSQLQLGYTAWYAKGRDIGLLSRWYSHKEKFDRMKKLDMQIGDVVMLYEREKAQKNNYIKSIKSCFLAKINSIEGDMISFDLINTVKPKYHGKIEFDNHTTAVKKMYYSNLPYEKLNVSRSTYSITEIGVEYLMYSEKFFILPLNQCDDVKVTYVSDGTRTDTLILHQNDLVYWILKDYDYEFNEDRFLAKYFKSSEPAYTRYMRGEVLEEEYYYRDNT